MLYESIMQRDTSSTTAQPSLVRQSGGQAPLSKGLAFMRAAHQSCLTTMGERDRAAAMNDFMERAVRLRFAFNKNEGKALQQLGLSTCAGDFEPLAQRFYVTACAAQGVTYPRLWETWHAFEPWVASKAVIRTTGTLSGAADYVVADNNRIAPGLGVLLPQSFMLETEPLACWEDLQMWWCLCFGRDAIVLARYAAAPESQAHGHGTAFLRPGLPARGRLLTRSQWALCNPKPAKDPAAQAA